MTMKTRSKSEKTSSTRTTERQTRTLTREETRLERLAQRPHETQEAWAVKAGRSVERDVLQVDPKNPAQVETGRLWKPDPTRRRDSKRPLVLLVRRRRH